MPTLEDSGPRRNRFTRTQVGATATGAAIAT